MLNALSPKTRQLLTKCRTLAMSGSLSLAVEMLETKVNSIDHSAIEQTAIALLKAELLSTDLQENKAIEVFANEIDPVLTQLPKDIALIVLDNLSILKMMSRDQDCVGNFYRLYDRRRITGFELWDTNAIVNAMDAARKNEHYKVLPVLWRQLLSTYELGCWRSYRWAATYMARECLILGWPKDAIYYSILAEEKVLSEEIGKQLLIWRKDDLIRSTINKIFSTANLAKHSEIAAALLEIIGDAVPDDLIIQTADWLKPKCEMIPSTWRQMNAFSQYWKALAAVSHRFDSELSQRIVATTVKHEYWKKPSVHRKHMIDVVISCVRNLSSEDLVVLAKHTIPLAVDANEKFDFDYSDVLNLLCHIAEIGGDDTKNIIADALYPDDGKPVNVLLMQIAHVFGKVLKNEASLREWAQKVASELRLQVQRLPEDEEPVEVTGTSMKCTRQVGREVVHVMLGCHDHSLNALIEHRRLLGTKELNELVSAILDMVSEPENITANKVFLIRCLSRMYDCMIPELATKTVDKLIDLASSTVIISCVEAYAEANNPLNPFKMNFGDPESLRGEAIYALAYIAKERADDVVNDHVNELLEALLTDTNDSVRRMAFIAAGVVPVITEVAVGSIILGTRDPSSEVARAAFYALAHKDVLDLPSNQWHSLIYSLSMSCHSPDAELRRAVAATLAKIRKWLPDNMKLKSKELEELAASLKSDICYSVRKELEDKDLDSCNESIQ